MKNQNQARRQSSISRAQSQVRSTPGKTHNRAVDQVARAGTGQGGYTSRALDDHVDSFFIELSSLDCEISKLDFLLKGAVNTFYQWIWESDIPDSEAKRNFIDGLDLVSMEALKSFRDKSDFLHKTWGSVIAPAMKGSNGAVAMAERRGA